MTPPSNATRASARPFSTRLVPAMRRCARKSPRCSLQTRRRAASWPPAMEVVTQVIAAQPGPSPIGRQIGHYQVLSLLGAGGMGEIYLARDTRLGRKLALKLLPAQFTRDADRLRRFEQEARAASALNHPNIITIHEIGQTG